MRYRSPAPIILGCVMFAAGWVVTLGGQYSLTVNEDRLINAQNEPQNWLLMNGDYGSLRYSQLTQINRETKMMRVKFPKIGKEAWIMWTNYGQYLVV